MHEWLISSDPFNNYVFTYPCSNLGAGLDDLFLQIETYGYNRGYKLSYMSVIVGIGYEA